MDFEDVVTLQIPMTEIGEGDEEAFSDRLTMFAEYVDVERFIAAED
jgi:hypothetical protein